MQPICILHHSFFLFVDQSKIAIALSTVIVFLSVLLFFGVRRFFVLKKENREVRNIESSLRIDENDKYYDNLTNGGLFR
jgi:hypothetical protein